MKIFLDDERFPAGEISDWVICRNFDEFKEEIENNGIPEFISFDHDLGPGASGYDCAKWLCNHILLNFQYVDFDWYVHSQNPVGKKNIEGYLSNFFTYMKKGNLYDIKSGDKAKR